MVYIPEFALKIIANSVNNGSLDYESLGDEWKQGFQSIGYTPPQKSDTGTGAPSLGMGDLRAVESKMPDTLPPPTRTSNVNPEFVAKHPTINKILETVSSPVRSVMTKPWVERPAQTAVETMFMTENPDKVSTGSAAGDLIADLFGAAAGIASPMSPGGGFIKGTMGLAEKYLPRISNRAADLAVKGAASSIPYDVAYGALNDGIDPRNIAINALASAGLSALPYGVGRVLSNRADSRFIPNVAGIESKVEAAADKIDPGTIQQGRQGTPGVVSRLNAMVDQLLTPPVIGGVEPPRGRVEPLTDAELLRGQGGADVPWYVNSDVYSQTRRPWYLSQDNFEAVGMPSALPSLTPEKLAAIPVRRATVKPVEAPKVTPEGVSTPEVIKTSDVVTPKAEAGRTAGSVAKNEIPIDERTFEDVGSRKVNAYQYDHPELKGYIQSEANVLLGELRDSIKGHRRSTANKHGERIATGSKRVTSDPLARILDETKATYAEIGDALMRLIHDEGAENQALAKRIELIIDDNLTHGRKLLDGTPVPPDAEYIALKEKITGKPVKRPSEMTVDEIDALATMGEPQFATPRKKAEPKVDEAGVASDGLMSKGGISAAKLTVPEKGSLIDGTKNQRVRSFQVTGIESPVSSPETKADLLVDIYPGGPGAYERISHAQSEAGAKQFFDEQGLDESLSYVMHSPDVSSYKTALAKEVIQRLEATGRGNMAVDVYESMAEQLTKAGQMTEAAKLFKALSPEGVKLKATKDIKKAYDKLPEPTKKRHEKKTEQVQNEFDKVNKETIEKVIEKTPQLQPRVTPGGKTQVKDKGRPGADATTKGQDKKKLDPAALLAGRIKQYVSPQGKPGADRAKEMVNTLFKKAKEVLPKQEAAKTAKRNELDEVVRALKSSEKYRKTWEGAKVVLKEKYGEVPQVMQDVEVYIEHYLNIPYSERSVERILNEAIKKRGFNVEQSAFAPMSPIFKGGVESRRDLIRDIIKQSGLTGQNADTLAMELGTKLDQLAKGKRDAKVSKLADQIIKAATGDAKAKDTTSNPIQEMFGILLQKAKEAIPKVESGKKAPQKDEMIAIYNALNNRTVFNQVWVATKKEIAKKLQAKGVSVEGANLDHLFSELLDHPYSTKQLNKAVDQGIKAHNIDLKQLVREHFTKVDRTGQDLAQKLTVRGMLTKDEAEVLAQDITERFNTLVGKKKQQILDQMFKQRTTGKPKPVDQKIIEWSNLGALSKEQYRRLIAEKLKLPVLTDDVARQLEELAQQAQKATGRELEILRAQMVKLIVEQIPTPFWRKVATIHTMSQLLNPKTAIRNIVGNLGFAAMENVSDVVGAAIDKPLSMITKKRTKALPSLTTQVKGVKQGFKLGLEDAKLSIDTYGVQTQFDLPKTRVFRKGPLGFAEKALNVELRATDRAFYQAARNESLRNQMKAAGVKEPTEEMINQAHLDGLYRTFQDDNALSSLFVGIKRLLNAKKEFGIGDFLVKYPKTPSNLLMRGIEYSPAGFVKFILEAAKPLAKKEFNQKAFVESFSRALVGSTALFGTGALLNKLGIITGRAEKDKDLAELNRQQGFGEYRVNASALKRLVFGDGNTNPQKGDQIVSYDWWQPGAIPVAIGADYNANKGEATGLVGTILKALATGINAFSEQPVVQGIETLLSGGPGQAEQGLVKVLQGVPASFVPTLLSQVRQLADNQRKETYSPDATEKAFNLAISKIPGAAGTLPQKYGTLGQPLQTYQDGGNNPANVFLNPAFINTYNPSPEVQRIFDVYSQTGETRQVPRVADKSITVSGQKFVLTGKEYSEYQRLLGEYTQQGFEKMPRNMKPEDAAKKMQEIMTDANTKAKTEILKARGLKVVKKGSGIAVR